MFILAGSFLLSLPKEEVTVFASYDAIVGRIARCREHWNIGIAGFNGDEWVLTIRLAGVRYGFIDVKMSVETLNLD